MTVGEEVDKLRGPVKPILDLWGELRRISGEAKFPALEAEHVRAIGEALDKARTDGWNAAMGGMGT